MNTDKPYEILGLVALSSRGYQSFIRSEQSWRRINGEEVTSDLEWTDVQTLTAQMIPVFILYQCDQEDLMSHEIEDRIIQNIEDLQRQPKMQDPRMNESSSSTTESNIKFNEMQRQMATMFVE